MWKIMVLFGIWTLLAGQASTVPLQMSLNRRELVRAASERPRTYIVHMERITPTDTMSTSETPHARYNQILQSVKRRSNVDSANEDSPFRTPSVPIHIYETVMSGFSAHLTPREASALRNLDGVLGVYPDAVRSLHTTRSPEFLGLSNLKGLWPQSQFGDDVIIGVLDTGIWPERESFSDEGLGPVPERWRGICQTGRDWNSSNCNKKLIGARYFSAGYEFNNGPMNETLEWRSPRDTEGHGTHTSSTVAGSVVRGANLNGLATGTARGMAPKARIAMYKICWIPGCYDSDILAAFDQAVADGVDVISLSVGGVVVPYNVDSIAIGALGAVKRGVFVSCSGGNDGPFLGTVSNVAPWVMTVAASTLDRSLPGGTLELGNGVKITGESLWYKSNGSVTVSQTALIYGSNAAVSNVTAAALCLADSLNATMVKGKIVVCMRGMNPRVEKGVTVATAGGAGMVLVNTVLNGENTSSDAHFLPALHLGYREGITLAVYMNATAAAEPVAKLKFFGTRVGVKPAPATADFSSRGPNILSPEVLKPDITAPGVNILAAWTGQVGPTGLNFDTRTVNFNMVSGTSMACPHVAGLGALLKSAHPDWSPSAIKSAIMTSASVLDNADGTITDSATQSSGTPWEFGSGHIKPEKALHPGLVYDMGFQDYVNFLCAQNSTYTSQFIKNFSGENVTCPTTPVPLENLNYPSFSAVFKQPPSPMPISINMTRTVKNVESGNATYEATIVAASGLYANVTVNPSVLTFAAKNETRSFTLRVTTVNAPDAALRNVSLTEFALLVWSDGRHKVQSPISITVYK